MEKNILFSNVCRQCGGTLKELKKGLFKCEYCDLEFRIVNQNPDHRLDDAVEMRNRLDFENADELLSSLINEKTIDIAEALFQRMLVSYGVSYVSEDGNKQKKPTINKASNISVYDHPDYIEALKKTNSVFEKDSFKSRASEIEEIRKNIMLKAEAGDKFDVFICYKRTSETNELTHDSRYARDIYDLLQKNGKKVFFAEKTLQNCVGQEYEPIIYSALKSASLMIVVAASPEKKYLDSAWVKNEWKRFDELVSRSNGKKTIVPVLCNGYDPILLPACLAKYQALKNEGDFYTQLLEVTNKYCKSLLTATVRKKQGIAEIKPIEIKEVPVEKRDLSSAVNIEISTSDSTTIQYVYEMLKSNNKDKFVRAEKAIVSKLSNSTENGMLYWLKVLCLMKSESIMSLESKMINNIDELIPYIDKSLTYCDETNRNNHLRILRKTTLYNLKNKKFYESGKLYDLLIQFMNDEDENSFAELYFGELLDIIGDEKYKISLEDFNTAFKFLYPSVAKLGTETLIDVYDEIGFSFIRRKQFDKAKSFLNKSKELFEADANALWGLILCDYKSKDTYTLKSSFSSSLVKRIESALTTMLKGGLDVNDFFKESVSCCGYGYDKNPNESKKCFQKIYELIPSNEEYNSTREICALYYANLLCMKKEFEIAKKYYNDAIANNNLCSDAFYGLLKCGAKAKNYFELLTYGKPYELTLSLEFWNLKEIVSRNETDSKTFQNFCNIHDSVLNNDPNRRKQINLENASKATSFFEREIDLNSIVEICRNEQVLNNDNSYAKSVIETYTEEECSDILAWQICYNAPLYMTFNTKANFLVGLIPSAAIAIFSVVLFLLGMLNQNISYMSEIWAINNGSALYPSIVIGVIGFIVGLICSRDSYMALIPRLLLCLLGAAIDFALIFALIGGLQSLAFSALENYNINRVIKICFIVLGIAPYVFFKGYELIFNIKYEIVNKKYLVTSLFVLLLVLTVYGVSLFITLSCI